MAEAYLNMAEACAMLDDAEACDWLNQLRRNRIGQYVDMQYSGEELINEIREERRKELCLEGHRWFDLRRTTRPRMVKVLQGKTYILEQDDPRYTIPIPRDAIAANPGLAN